MITQYSLKMPRAVFAGENSTDKLESIIAGNHLTNIAVFTDKAIRSLGLADIVTNVLDKVGVDYCILDDIPAEPSYMAVQKIIDELKAKKADFVIACGGGSVMDTAKLAGVLITNEYGVKDLLDDPARAKKCVSTLAIPTTAGTGAETTPNAIVGVPEKNLKIGIVNDALIPDYVILDHRLIDTLPLKISGSTGVDALCHAVECFTSAKANPISDTFALEACDLIFNNIISACKSKEAAPRSAMQLAAFYAGIAITASGTTAIHALSYPLGGRYHIAHGVSNAILLCPVMRFNESFISEKLAAVYDRVFHGENPVRTAEEKSHYMIAWMEQIVKELEIPTSLKSFGVPAEDLDDLVTAGLQVTRLLVNNIRPVTAADARMIYQSIL